MTDQNEAEKSLNPSAWMERHADYLYRYALSRLRDAESAEEVVQETFLAGLRAKDQYGGKGTERAWLLGILKRKIVDLVRRKSRTSSLDFDDTAEDPGEVLFDQKGHWRADPRFFGSSPHELLERDEFWQAFRNCLAALPQRQADVFSFREMDGISSQEICKDLDISASNLWVLLHRARLGLSRCLKMKLHLE